jgi:hypothetical protein
VRAEQHDGCIEHRVRSGETLDSIASANDLTWRLLARFNFGTDDPSLLNAARQAYVGCTHRTADAARERRTMRIAIAMTTLVLAAPVGVAAEDTVAGCIDASRYPSLSGRRDCLERSSDPLAIPALHRLAREVAANQRSPRVVSHEFWSLAEGAGWVAARTNDEFLREKVRSTDIWDQLFAIRALRTGRRGPTVEEGSARQRGIEEELRRACEPLRGARDRRLDLEGRLCRTELVAPDDVDLPRSSRSTDAERGQALDRRKRRRAADGGGLGAPTPPAEGRGGSEGGR